jgi:Flp pilus assembly protein TadD
MKQLLAALIVLYSIYTISAQTSSKPGAVLADATVGNREQDGLSGPVRRVRVEKANIVTRDGKQVELARSLMAVSTYDAFGRKMDSVAYPVEGASAPGKEEYKYDDKGNIIEMTLRGDNGSVLLKEKYSYEFDEFGNWKKMTAAVAVSENGNITYEPSEITYRTLTYYYGPVVPKASSPAAPAATRRSRKPENATESSMPNKQAASQPASVVSASVPVETSDKVPEVSVPAEANPAKREVNLPVLRIPEDVLRKAAIELPEPHYTSAASLAGATGQVQVELIIDQNGTVNTARATSGNPILFEAATAAASKSRFLMSAFSDHPTNAYSVLTYNFQNPSALTTTSSNTPTTITVPTAEKSAYSDARSPATPPMVAETNRSSSPPLESKNNPDINGTATSSSATYFNNGIANIASANYEDAVKSLTQAVTLDPEDAIAFSKLGVAYSALGQHKRAITAFKQALKINRTFVDADSYFRLGGSYLALSEYSAAIEPLKQALYSVKARLLEGRTSSLTGPAETEINQALGLAYYGSGSYRMAAKAFEAAITLKPDFASAHYGLALSYLEIGDKRSVEKEEQILRKLNSPLADRLAGLLLIPAGQRNKIF